MKKFKEYIQEQDQMKDLEAMADADQAGIIKSKKPIPKIRDLRPSPELDQASKIQTIDTQDQMNRAMAKPPPPKPMGMGKFGTVNPIVPKKPAVGQWNTTTTQE
jgi:hypothetical protein